MCRLLWVRSTQPFAIPAYLERFAAVARNSSEYQGHGWGCAWLARDGWCLHHDINPIWEAGLSQFGSTTLLLAHARSAFRDEGIAVENNMPFFDGARVFIFNGELRGVRIRQDGRIGAEKIFNYIKRFALSGGVRGLEKSIRIIEKKTRYIRAMNLIIASRESSLLATLFNEQPAYFQMHRRQHLGVDLVCSEPYAGESGWHAIAGRSFQML